MYNLLSQSEFLKTNARLVNLINIYVLFDHCYFLYLFNVLNYKNETSEKLLQFVATHYDYF